MRARERTGRELRLLALANRQFGLLKHEDLCTEGLTRGDIDNRLTSCRRNRVHDLVYAFGHTILRDQGRWLAAIWTTGDDTVLSHLAAAAYHAMRTAEPDEPIHVSTTGEAKSRNGLVVHRVRYLHRLDIYSPHPLLVTTIPRTLIDLADVLPWDEYRAVADGLPKLRLDRVKEAQERAPGRRGAPLFATLLEACRLTTEVLRLASRYPASSVGTDYQLSGHRIMRLVWDDLHPNEALRTAHRVRQMLTNSGL